MVVEGEFGEYITHSPPPPWSSSPKSDMFGEVTDFIAVIYLLMETRKKDLKR